MDYQYVSLGGGYMQTKTHLKDRVVGSLLGGAIGDALGYTVEFMGRNEILSRFGSSGITNLVPDSRTGKALISDDTQMTLFTADGIRWANQNGSDKTNGMFTESGLYPAYMRWYYTQQGTMPFLRANGWLERFPHEETFSLLDQEALFARRAPGNTCLTALGSGSMGTMKTALNRSKGCGGIMRVAPVGLFFYNEPDIAFRIGAESSAITHGHPTGYLTAGAFAVIIGELVNDKTIEESVDTAIGILKQYRSNEETIRALERAVGFAHSSERPESAIAELGEGWVADETLAIALYCAIKRKDFRHAVIMAVNHSGDSDSTGAICGNLLGAAGGIAVIPEDWITGIELRETIETMGIRLLEMM